jgi:vacuolar-type H+-ATPase subunit I/STV1
MCPALGPVMVSATVADNCYRGQRDNTLFDEKMKTNKTRSHRLLEAALFMAIMYGVVQISIALGIEEKAWWEKTWDFITGGTIGLISGVGIAIFIGTIGWVSGPIYGSIGALGLAAGGALGGLGLGAIVNIIRDPKDYDFAWGILVPTLLLGGLAATYLSQLIAHWLMPILQRRAELRSVESGKSGD